MNIEAKATLGYQEYKKGCEQLQETMRMVSNQIGPNIDSSWRIIMVLYGTNYDPSENICQSCAPYIITCEDDFKKKLENIIDNNIPMKKERIQDFRLIIMDILPPRVQLPDELIDEITNNIEKAGSAENIIYWNPGQYDLAYFFNYHHREILASIYSSTRKTILMEHCTMNISGSKSGHYNNSKNCKMFFIVPQFLLYLMIFLNFAAHLALSILKNHQIMQKVWRK